MSKAWVLLAMICGPAAGLERNIADFPTCDSAAKGAEVTALNPLDDTDCSTGGGTADPHPCWCDGSGTWRSITDLDGLSTPVAIAEGGTGATTATGALTNLGIANHDLLAVNSAGSIMSLSASSASLELESTAVSGERWFVNSTSAGLFSVSAVGFGSLATINTGGLLTATDFTCVGCVDVSSETNLAVSSPITLTGDTVGLETLAGDVTGTIGATVVGDNSHAHTGLTLSGIDISDDTNLAVVSPVTLTGDTVGLETLGGDVTGTIAATVVGNDSHSHTDSTVGALALAGDVTGTTSASVVGNDSHDHTSSTLTPFPSGTKMVFFQASCPSGWTQVTTAALDGSALRVETGTGGGSGGSADISAANTGSSTSANVSNHSHSVNVDSVTTTTVQSGTGATVVKDVASGSTGSTEDFSTHNHTLAFKFANVVICSSP